jgi:hypothetical protein
VRRGRARSGFTIVEVVLAMGVLLFGMTAILGMLSFGAGLVRTAQLRTSAAAAAEAVVADLEESLLPLLRDARTGEVRVGPPHEIVDRPVPLHPGLCYSARAVGVPRPGEPAGRERYLRVDVEMSWTAGGLRRRKAFSTLLSRSIPFGERLRREFVERDLDPLGPVDAQRENPPVSP